MRFTVFSRLNSDFVEILWVGIPCSHHFPSCLVANCRLHPQFPRRQVHHLLLLLLPLPASRIPRLDEPGSKTMKGFQFPASLTGRKKNGARKSNQRINQETTLLRLPLTSFMLPSISVMVFPRPRAFKSSNCTALRVMFCSLKTSLSLDLLTSSSRSCWRLCPRIPGAQNSTLGHQQDRKVPNFILQSDPICRE